MDIYLLLRKGMNLMSLAVFLSASSFALEHHHIFIWEQDACGHYFVNGIFVEITVDDEDSVELILSETNSWQYDGEGFSVNYDAVSQILDVNFANFQYSYFNDVFNPIPGMMVKTCKYYLNGEELFSQKLVYTNAGEEDILNSISGHVEGFKYKLTSDNQYVYFPEINADVYVQWNSSGQPCKLKWYSTGDESIINNIIDIDDLPKDNFISLSAQEYDIRGNFHID